MTEMKMFTFYWGDGFREVLVGDGPLGTFIDKWGHGLLVHVQCVREGDNHDYEWRDREWVRRDENK